MPNIKDYNLNQAQLTTILGSLLTDITAVRTALWTMATKLNADAWVTDTDYAWAAALTTTNT